MAVQVRNRLARMRAIIDDEAKAGCAHAELRRDFRRLEQQMTKNLFVFGPGVHDARYWLLWHYENVRRRLAVDVFEGDDEVILVNDAGRYLTRGNFFEQRHDGSMGCAR